jgi:5-hydroxyisourate hydrolase
MSRISTHVLDTVVGKPAAEIAVRLEMKEGDGWTLIATGATDADGRCSELAKNAAAGEYRLTFSTGAYLARNSRTGIFREISITVICNGEPHYHFPLLLSNHSYTTYRGS